MAGPNRTVEEMVKLIEEQAEEIAELKLAATEQEAKHVLFVEAIHQSSEEAIAGLKLAASERNAKRILLIERIHQSKEEIAGLKLAAITRKKTENVSMIDGIPCSEEEWLEYIEDQEEAMAELKLYTERKAENARLSADKDLK